MDYRGEIDSYNTNGLGTDDSQIYEIVANFLLGNGHKNGLSERGFTSAGTFDGPEYGGFLYFGEGAGLTLKCHRGAKTISLRAVGKEREKATRDLGDLLGLEFKEKGVSLK